MGSKSNVKLNEALTLFADSTVGQLYLKLVSGNSTEAKVSVIDLEGHTMIERNIPTNQLTYISLNDIREGLYIARVEFENHILAERFKF